MNLQIRQSKIGSWEYVRWKPFNFVVGEGPACTNKWFQYVFQTRVIQLSPTCVILVAVASSGSEIIEEDPGGPPVAGSKTKPGLNRVKVIFHEEIKVAKRYRRKKIKECRKSEGVLVIFPFSSSGKRL